MTDSRLRLPAPAAIAGAILTFLLAACTSSGSAGWTYAPLPPTPSGAASPSGSAGASGSPGATGSPGASVTPAPSGSAGASASPGGGTTIELEETGSLQIVQAGAPVTELQLTAGQSYTFRINNTANFDHNFYLGPAERLSAGDVDGLPGVPVNQSGVQEFSWTATAEAATWQFACTVLGHYQLMHGELVIDGQ